MKHLNIKWVPETMIMVSLTIASSPKPSAEPQESQTTPSREIHNSAPCTKRIIISDGLELRARVMNQTALERM